MGKYIIEGGNRLDGQIKVQGAKNSALPILAAAVAVGKPCVIHNCPDLTDINATIRILRSLGCRAEKNGTTVTVDGAGLSSNIISECLMREMRSSIIFMGALISRTGSAEITAPGGCDIGLRPFDLHLSAMRRLGVEVTETQGKILCSCKRVKGGRITLSFPSVGATENIILASVRASGVTTVINAAREPEIVDLVRFLNSCGARIRGAGESVITVEGVDRLYPTQYTIMPDRIVAATYMAAAAVTGSSITLDGVVPGHLASVTGCFEQMGCNLKGFGSQIKITSPQRLVSPETLRTMPYPGFPTDCQAIVMAAACTARGTTVISENIFENRFRHVSELDRMGADIEVHDRIAVVNGVDSLRGTTVNATDLRAGAALVIAGLCADGTTIVRNIHYIDRGYDGLADNLASLGAAVKRKDQNEKTHS